MISLDLKNKLKQAHIEDLATDLISQWLTDDWQFKWDHAKTRFGLCNYARKTIQLSKKLAPFLNDKEIVDVIIHEIAHALAGHKNSHNHIWKQQVIKLGGQPSRTKHVEFDNRLLGAKYVLQDKTGEIYRYYYRKPTQAMQSLNRMWIKGKKRETYGNLLIKKLD